MFDRDLAPAPADADPAAGVLTAPGPYGFCSWVALLVEPVRGREVEQDRSDEAIADAGWLAGQWDTTAGARLELRYLHRPGQKLRCVLLGRVQAPTRDAAIAAALRLRDRLSTLPAHVRAVPVDSAADLRQLLDPFPAHPSGLVEVRKQIHPGRPVRPDAGVHYYLAVPGFSAGTTTWEPLWQSIADLPQPFMLTVGLEPYAPSPAFVGMLADLATRYGRLAVPGRSALSPLRQQSYELPADPFAQYASELFTDAWRRYRTGVFRTRITLASPQPLPEALVTRVAAAIGARGHVVVAPEPYERETAWRNVTTLDNARWDRRYLGRLEVPTGLRLLAETMDANEAVSAWRLPPAPAPGARPVFVSVHGDVFHNSGDNAVFVSRSTVSGSFNSAPAPAAGADGPRLNILLACANPRGSEPLRTGEEDRTLRQSIRLSAERDRIDIETLNAVTIDDLRRALMTKQYDIVHFSGHGTNRGLVFENDAGQIFQPPSAALGELFARRKIKVAVLNACYSLTASRMSAIGTEYTIAFDGPLSDPAAIEFTRGFYDALGAGLTVPEAYDEGRGAAALKGLTFTAVLLRAGEDHMTP
ncbi:CHAT domain-containing protein [Actinoplanes sp. NPDC049596]|uniref:CHAT domain-containing protein n=1 Tax=unclassified Actinoplanes TaxID=2626549 RepID=UPI0034315FF0